MARYAILLLLCSCGQVKHISKPHWGRAHILSKTQQYLLTDLPLWANFSERGQCQRHSPVRFLHYGHLNKSFSYNYGQIVQLQLLFNEKYRNTKKNLQIKILSPEMEDKIFFQTQDQINSNILPFLPPQIKKSHLLWIDPALEHPHYKKILIKILNSDDFYRGHPILVSQCLNKEQMVTLIHSLIKEDIDFRLISSEMFSPFDQNFNLTYEFQLPLDTILKGKERILYTIGHWYPSSLKGTLQIKKFPPSPSDRPAKR